MPKSKEFLTSSDSENSDSDNNAQPKPKKKKPEAKNTKQEAKPEKAGKKSGGPSKGAGGEYMFQLSAMRYATISEFRGKVMVGIREYYEKDGELRPGKKGISLNLEQWKALKDNMEEIDECLKTF